MRVLRELHGPRQGRELLSRRPHDDDRPVEDAVEQPRDPLEEGGTVPLEGCLRRSHPGRAAARKHDPRAPAHEIMVLVGERS
jgi:hypothetical protein